MKTTICARHLAVILAVATSWVAGRAFAETPPVTAAAKKEAADRFDRGLHLFNQGDNAGALAEFVRAHELTHDPLILYNVGLVYAEMKRPVEAVDALDQLLASGAPLTPTRKAEAERVRGDEAASISFVEIVTNVPAAVELDSIEVARTPLSGPLRVSSGSHVIGAIAVGHEPVRKTIDIAGRETRRVELTLIPLQATLGHLNVRSELPAADVVLDGKVVGRTPVASPLSVIPGAHRIELRRSGYRPIPQSVALDEGATTDVKLDAEIDVAEARRTGGGLFVEASESASSVVIDGKPITEPGGEIWLPAGRHHLTVARGGFETVDRDVSVPVGATAHTKVDLYPLPETKEAFVNHAHRQRAIALSVFGVGLVAAIGGGALAYKEHKDLVAANGALADVARRSARFSGDPACDPALGGDPMGCVSDANQKVSTAQSAQLAGYIGLGVGAAVAVTGVVLLFTSDDPGRYDHFSPKATATVSGWMTPGAGGLVLRASF